MAARAIRPCFLGANPDRGAEEHARDRLFRKIAKGDCRDGNPTTHKTSSTFLSVFACSRHKKNGQKNPLDVSNSRWLAYATAGVATAFGAIPSAEAEIHYSGVVNVVLPGRIEERSSTLLPLSHGASINLLNFDANTFDYVYAGFKVLGAAVSHGFRADKGCRCEVRRFHIRTHTFVSQGFFRNTHNVWFSGDTDILSVYNNEWDKGGQGYIGFKFNTGAGTQYGWVRIGIQPRDVGMKVFDYAWGDPGDAILTGQTSSTGDMVDAVPDSGSLGLLALGGAGLMAWRKRRASANGAN